MWFRQLVRLLVLFLPCCLYGQTTEVRDIAVGLAQDIAASGRKTVAVVDFTDLQGLPTELGRFLSEELSVALARARKGFEIVERNQLNALMREHKLAATGLIDQSTAMKLGQLAGADALVTGTLTPFGDTVRISVKVLATDTARMITADTADLPKTKTIEELLNRSAARSPDSQSVTPASTSTAGNPSNRPVFQNSVLRATLDQLAVTSDFSRATLSFTIENISREPLRLALDQESFGGPSTVALADDLANDWSTRSVSGLFEIVPTRSARLNDFKDDSFSMLGPGERVVLITTFGPRRSDNRSGGTIFSFTAKALYRTPSDTRRVTIGLTGIKPTVLGR